MDFKFNHDTDSLYDAIGITKESADDLQNKSKEIVLTQLKTKNCRASHFIEKACTELSYSQVVMLAGFYLLEKSREARKQAEKEKKQDIDKGLSLIEDLIDKLGIKGTVIDMGSANSMEELIAKLKKMNDDRDSKE